MKAVCLLAICLCVWPHAIQADEVYTPGDKVVVIQKVDLTEESMVVGNFGRGVPLTVQAVDGDKIRVKGERPGWIPSSAVIPVAKSVEYFSGLLNKETANHSELFDRGMVWLALGEYDKAIADFTKCIELGAQPSDYNERGFCWLSKGEKGKAILDFNAAIELAPKNAGLHLNRGITFEEMGQIDKALSDYDAAIALNSSVLQALQRRGGIHLRQGNFEMAITDFTSAVELDPMCIDCFVNRGQSWMNSGKLPQAIDDYSKALALDDTSIAALFNRGIAFEANQETTDAFADYNRILQMKPQNLSALYRRGSLKLRQRDNVAALEDFNAALKVDPSNDSVLRQRASALYNLKRYEEAIADQSLVVEKNPKDPMILVDRGMGFKNLGKSTEAIADFTKSVEIDPNSSVAYWAYLGRAELHQNAGDYTKAILDYSAAFSKQRTIVVLYGRAKCHRALGRVNDAMSDLRIVVANDTKHFLARNDLAWILATWPEDSIRNGKEAVQLAENACELTDWKNPLVLDTLAAAYAQSGDFASAVKYATQARDMMTPAVAKSSVIDEKLKLYQAKQPFREVVNAPENVYLPGDRVVATVDADLLDSDKKSGQIERGMMFVVQAIDENKIRLRGNGAGWTEAKTVVPIGKAVDYFSNLIDQEKPNAVDLYARAQVYSATREFDKSIEDLTQAIKMAPTAHGYHERGYCWQQKRELEKAIADYSKAMELAPTNSMYIASRGIAYHIVGNLDKALTDYNAALAIDPRQVAALQNRGSIRTDRGALAEAIADFTAAIEVDPKCVDCFVNRGRNWVIAGATSQGIEDYNKALSLDDTSVAAHYNRGIVLQTQGKNKEALADFDRILQVQPDNIAAVHHRGQVKYNLGEYEAAVTDYQLALQLEPKNKFILQDLAKALTDVHRNEEAIQAANTVLDSEPDNALTRLWRGVAFQDLGRSQEALADFNAALSEKSRPDLGRFLGFAYYRRGATLAMLDQQEKAIADFDVVLSSNRDGATFASRAMCFSTLGKTKEAIADYRSAIEITSKFPHVFNGLAWLLATSSDNALRNGSEAVEYARKACELTGWKDGDYIDTLAAAFAETGDFESAVKYQKQAMELMQGDATDTTERLHLYEAAKPFRQNTAKSEKPLTEQWEAMGT